MDSIQFNVKTTTVEQREMTVMKNDALMAFAADLAERSGSVFADVWKLGQQIVFKSYSSTDDNREMFTAILNSLHKSPAIQNALCNYWQRAGLNVSTPAPGSKSFIVGGVLDRGYQEKAFSFVLRTPPMQVERKATPVRAPKQLKGTAVERARNAVASLIKRTAKDDPYGAAAINEMMQEHTCCLFDKDGEKLLLDVDEVTLIRELLTLRIEGRFKGFETVTEVAVTQ
jgi:hypothetical protein